MQDESKRREQEAADAYDKKLAAVSSHAISMKFLVSRRAVLSKV